MLGFPRGTIRATVLLETLLASFEMVNAGFGQPAALLILSSNTAPTLAPARLEPVLSQLGTQAPCPFISYPAVTRPALPCPIQEEILFELREHSAGLNCGRWDYIFS